MKSNKKTGRKEEETDWSKRFDERFHVTSDGSWDGLYMPDDIKQFIASEKAVSFEAGRQRGKKEIIDALKAFKETRVLNDTFYLDDLGQLVDGLQALITKLSNPISE